MDLVVNGEAVFRIFTAGTYDFSGLVLDNTLDKGIGGLDITGRRQRDTHFLVEFFCVSDMKIYAIFEVEDETMGHPLT